MVKGEWALSQTIMKGGFRESASDLGGGPEALWVLASLAEAGSLLLTRTGSVASDQLVEKGERDLIRFVIRRCAHDRLTEHLRQTTLFERRKGGKRVKRNQIGP